VKRVMNTAAEVPGEDEDSYTREDDSIPLADGDPADFVEDSLVSEDKRKVGLGSIFFVSSTRETQNFYCRSSSGERRWILNHLTRSHQCSPTEVT